MALPWLQLSWDTFRSATRSGMVSASHLWAVPGSPCPAPEGQLPALPSDRQLSCRLGLGMHVWVLSPDTLPAVREQHQVRQK